jgi:hypothetical protein
MPRTKHGRVLTAGVASALAAIALAGTAHANGIIPQSLQAAPPATATPLLADIEACPFAQLKKAYDAAMTGADTLDVFAIDKEILTVCNERSKILVGIVKQDRELGKLLAPAAPVGATATATSDHAATKLAAAADAAPAGQDAPAMSATITASAPAAGLQPAGHKPVAQSATASASAPAPAVAECTTPYATYALVAPTGSTLPTTGGVVNEATGALYTVKAGDPLPGGYTVKTVSASGVTLLHGGTTWLLPANTKSFPVPAEGFYAVPVTAKADAGTAAAPGISASIPTLPESR